MARAAMVIGGLLIAVTLGVIVANQGFKSFTVLIPSILGVLIALAGYIALNPHYRKHAMHGAVLVGLVGAIACLVQGSKQLTKLGTDVAPTTVQLASVWLSGILCTVFVVLCIKSFIDARRKPIEV